MKLPRRKIFGLTLKPLSSYAAVLSGETRQGFGRPASLEPNKPFNPIAAETRLPINGGVGLQ
jgi:hypothetical protein